ncbi:sucrose-6-phosphate hydrolase [Pseudalkalibacillus sp. A8]|uniref:sucrose-6-phosphate hydrolase n=1 Tax=Pseudalkalibacillus sp. A8 TaxID=3382641 RepID=UPI0038B4DE2A
MEWTKEMRYRRLEDVDDDTVKKIRERVLNCKWRQKFHIQPQAGLLNDPNGFSFFNGEYHLFYQWFPLGPVHGLKYWYHTKSKDLVHWENVGIAIKPDKYYDSHGAYSGSAIEYRDQLFLMYTGNTRNDNWERHPYQVIAVMNKQGEITKPLSPAIAKVPEGYTDHFRDPKVWKSGDTFFAVIGAQRKNKTGCAVLYCSKNLTEWTFLGELKTDLDHFGYMWECPDYFELDGNGVFVFSPQGLKPDGDHYQNIYQSGYIIGDKLDLDTLTFSDGHFHELDRGFDFYAPQTTYSPEGRRILVGWLGLPEIAYPTDQNNWAHCLTLPRELTVENGKLLQKPIQELKKLRKEKSVFEATIANETVKAFTGTSFELICEMAVDDSDIFGIEFRAKGDEKTIVKYDAKKKKIILDRMLSGQPVGEAYGTRRQCSLAGSKIKFHLFVDISSVEIFVNDGEEVFTSRIFPKADSNEIRFFADGGRASFRAEKWEL